jgi:hypothetical protein
MSTTSVNVDRFSLSRSCQKDEGGPPEGERDRHKDEGVLREHVRRASRAHCRTVRRGSEATLVVSGGAPGSSRGRHAVAGSVPAAPAGLPRAGLGADVLGTGAQARGSEGAEGVYVDCAP